MTALDDRTGPPTAAGRPATEPLSARLGRAVPLLVGAALVLLLSSRSVPCRSTAGCPC